MSYFLSAKGENILGWSGTDQLLASVREELRRYQSQCTSASGLQLYQLLGSRIADEIARDQQFAADFAAGLGTVASATDIKELQGIYVRLSGLIVDFFTARGSVVAGHTLGTTLQDRVVQRLLELSEQWMDRHGFGPPPVPYCWYSLGRAGRKEIVSPGEYEGFIVHGGDGDGVEAYFSGLASRISTHMKTVGLVPAGGMVPVNASWRGSIGEWRTRLSQGFAWGRNEEALSTLIALADQRYIYGSETLADRMTTLVRSMLEYHRGAIVEVARSTSTMPAGLDFFGRLRVERSGRHRGEFDLERYALLPLVSNVRIYSIFNGVHQTSTVGRVRALLGRGKLNVELAERLLNAYFDIMEMLFARKLSGGAADVDRVIFIDPEELGGSDGARLKGSLEAVVSLERIVFSALAGQG